MNVLLINKFLYPKGGDAISTITTGRILESYGHHVVFWGMAHPSNPPYSFQDSFVSQTDYDLENRWFSKARSALNILYSTEARRKIAGLLNVFKPDIVHLNNFAHQISPSILDEIKKYDIPTVMTMRDYKMVCPSYSMLAKGKLCERCAHGRYRYCALYRCTKGSLFKSLVNVAEMVLHHDILHIYDKIDLYVSPSRFLMNKVKEMGLKGDVLWLPNCIDVTEYKPDYNPQENSMVYVGRLSSEKGIETLIEASKGLGVRLKIIGDGPLKETLEKKCSMEKNLHVDFYGYLTGSTLLNEIKKSMFLVIPSECYENNPRVVIEAFALGKPVVGARIGGIPELVKDWETGLTYTSGDAGDLNSKMKLMIDNKDNLPDMGKNARVFVEKELSSEIHYNRLMEIYALVKDKAEK